ncbi:MAG TPA: hypothetical protein VFP93_00670 [Gammaproteobacteria bacterium]|nr:hypothetical protein [Gammaproteobacteria bacterium]
MFEIGWGELCVVGLLMLFLIKPEHIPVFAKIMGRKLLQLKSSLDRFKAELKAEFQDNTNNVKDE